MIPKLYATKDSGYSSSFYPHHGGIPNGMPNPMATAFLPNYIPEHVVVRTNGEMDSLLHNHRRKMLRRAANRRSAQLSRARKKTFMEDLKVENVRLQNLVDMLDSQPDLVFCVNLEGQITYISERTKNYVKTDESSEEDPSHMSQILTNESMDALTEALSQVKQSCNSDNQVDYSRVSAVKEVCFHDSNGYPTVGYLRCSRVVRRPGMDEQETNRELESQAAANANMDPLPKKAKKGDETVVDTTSSANTSSKETALAGALVLQSLQMSQQEQQQQEKNSLISDAQYPESNNSGSSNGRRGHSKFNSGNSDSNTSEDSNTKTEFSTNEGQPAGEEFEEEFICVIRPADASIPQGASVMFQTYLSTASMVEHDRKRDIGTTRNDSNMNLANTNRGGSPSCSISNDSGSDDKFGSGSSKQTISDLKGTGTSSETGSDESDSA